MTSPMEKVNAIVYSFDAGFRVSMVCIGLTIFCYSFPLAGSRENPIIFDRNSVIQNRVQTTNPGKSPSSELLSLFPEKSLFST